MGIRDPYADRQYRAVIEPAELTCFRVTLRESDLMVCARTDISEAAMRSLTTHRAELEDYIEKHPSFRTSFRPVPVTSDAPEIVRDMGTAAELFDVGPMAAVAGAVSQHVGTDLLTHSDEVIVENGGDIFTAGGRKRRVRVYAGESANAVDIIVEDTQDGIGLCTSSAKVGPSVSLGSAEAVVVLARTATIADAAATAFCNRVRSHDDVSEAIENASIHPEVQGIVIVTGESVGAWGGIEFG